MRHMEKPQLPEDTNNDPNLAGANAPLMSWDIFLDSYHRKMQLLDDAEQLIAFSNEFQWKHQWDFRKILLAENKVILVTDATDLSIISASSNLVSMTGYTPAEVIGKTPRFFQGPATQPEGRKIIRSAVEQGLPFETSLINYRKTGQPYDCLIQGFPVWNKMNKLSHFIAFESEFFAA